MFGRLVTKMLPLVPRPIVRAVAMRYVAGEDLDSAAVAVKNLNDRGYLATMDILGEDTSSEAHADETVGAYVDVLDRIAADGLAANISVKLTHLGIRLDPVTAASRVEALVVDAARRGNFVRIDMEDSSLTQATLDLFAELRTRHGNVGTVLQACLRRTEGDARTLAARGANLRLCKGIYRESAAIAFQHPDEVRASYLRTADALLEGADTYTAFATHDRGLIESLVQRVRERGIPYDRFEFQALLGVPVEDLLERLVGDGFTVRWYVPFGLEWFAYSTRRLKENPRMATYIVRQIFSPRNRASRT
jgi:proline dehydrogenase